MARSDDDRRAADGASLVELVLDAELGEAVGQEAHRFVVGEVGLLNPALGLGSEDAIDVAEGATLDAHGETAVVDRAGADDDARLLRFGRGRFDPAGFDDLGEGVVEPLEALMRHRGDLEHAVTACFEVGTHEVREVAPFGNVDLVECDQLGALEQRLLALGHRVGAELAENHVEVAERIAAGLEGCAVEHVQQCGAALDVAQELEAEALTLARALDQAGNVGDGIARLAGVDHTEVRVQGGEGVVGDLGLGRGHRRDQAGLAGRGIADQRNVGHGLEFEVDITLEAEGTEQREAGSLALGGGERGVTQSALATGCHDKAQAGLVHVEKLVALHVLDDGADGHQEFANLGVAAVAVVTHAGAAVFGAAVRGAMVTEQCGGALVGDEDEVATVTAVTAVRAGERLELLSLYRDTAIASVTRSQMQRHVVNKCGHWWPLSGGENSVRKQLWAETLCRNSVQKLCAETREGGPKPALTFVQQWMPTRQPPQC